MLTREIIIQKLGLEDSDLEVQDEMLQKLADSVSTRIMLKMSEQLSDQDLDELADLIDASKDDEVESYITSKIPNYEEFKAKIEEDTINELESNSQAIDTEVEGRQKEHISVD